MLYSWSRHFIRHKDITISRGYFKGKVPSLQDIRNVVPDLSFDSIKQNINKLEPPSFLPNWYSDYQKNFMGEWDNIVRKVTWSQSDFEDDNIVKHDPMLVMAKAMVEFGSLASKTRTSSHLIPITVGLYMLMNSQVKEIPDDLILQEICDANELFWFYQHAHIAKAPYARTRRSYLIEKTFITPECIISSRKSETCRPGYILARNDHTKEIILAFCGTQSTADFLLDITASNVKFMSGYTHRGALIAAKWCLDHLDDKIDKQFENYPDYTLKLVGHSLGGAIAVLFTCMLQDRHPIRTITFGAPPVCSESLIEHIHQPITNLVLENDIVPQLSLENFCRLEKKLISSDWKGDLKKQMDTVSKHPLGNILSSVVNKLVINDDDKKIKAIESSFKKYDGNKDKEVLNLIANEVNEHQEEVKDIINNEISCILDKEPIMYHPGTLIQIYSKNVQNYSYVNNQFALRELDTKKFPLKDLSLSDKMLSDHAMKNYIKALWASIKHSKGLENIIPPKHNPK